MSQRFANGEISAIDLSKKMLAKAREKANKFNKKVQLIQMDAQNMDDFNPLTVNLWGANNDPVAQFNDRKRQ